MNAIMEHGHEGEDGFNLMSASLSLGQDKNFFSTMKHGNIAKFDYVKSLGKNMVEGYNNYVAEFEQTKNIITDIYYILEEKRKVSSFCRCLADDGLYASDASAQNSLVKLLFAIDNNGSINHNTFLKIQKILKTFNEVKKGLF